ncbi:sigma-54-dependent transcriptional regulator [Sphingomonas prati]|uniref:Two-component system C4-dicarboxylate transport response regulator DctD n=2 Tax=Sphingomonas prati TaxID=1843237 RepID=A0A7W9F200_9SPHN|nr:sigma-54 dependent transcriptional regulator [Sphingomonas prati]MBB5727970.1 two-component system C4-dicarboxylate transport response regulator DctD [Sphingomonas prati]GGE82275.1 C4-dicarboxylate transport transcriptional regulatory protein DctD [Sphingomonas prati]
MENDMQVLLVDDDDGLRGALAQAFELAGIDVIAEHRPAAALARIDPAFPGIVVSDVRMPGMEGTELFRRIAAIDAEIPVILMTGHGDVAMAVAALKDGAHDFVTKPFAADRLIASARRAMATRRLVLDNRALRAAAEQAAGGDALIGETAVMVRLRDTIVQVAQAEVDILIEGETGTGKEMVATLLHRGSARRARPFVAVNCAALPDGIAEGELFGNVYGGSGRLARVGRIEASDHGTLFLDEIESMTPGVQGKLLRVIEEREVMAIGAEAPRTLDLRIVAAAKEDLAVAVADGRFRADLLYRLDAVRLRVPPLRERRADVPLLFGHLLTLAATRFARDVPRIDAAVQARLADHDWPGNVRELRNFAQRVVLGVDAPAPEAATPDATLPERVERFEAAILRTTLEQTAGDVRTALTMLGIPRKTFYDKVARHGIELDSYRGG